MERAAALYNLMSPKDQQITTAGMYRAMIALKLSREAVDGAVKKIYVPEIPEWAQALLP